MGQRTFRGAFGRIAPDIVALAALAVAAAVLNRPGRESPHAAAPAGDGEPDRARGRLAESPRGIPPPGWRDILWRTWREFNSDNIAMVARSIAFSAVFALFPGLAAFIALYGLFADPASAREHLAILTGFVPAGALTWIGEEMARIATEEGASLSFTFLVGLAVALWSVNAAMKALVRGLNIAYGEREKRSFLRLNLLTMTFTVGAILFLLITTGAVVVIPVALGLLRIHGDVLPLAWLRWPALFVLALIGTAAIYRLGPSRARARWRWLTWGSVAASALWLLGSFLFSWYVANFANYSATYGSLGAVFGFLTWTWLSAVIVLLGAKLNAEIEHQTAMDSTTGPPAPMGARGAVMADTLGEAASVRLPGRLLSPPGWLSRAARRWRRRRG